MAEEVKSKKTTTRKPRAKKEVEEILKKLKESGDLP